MVKQVIVILVIASDKTPNGGVDRATALPISFADWAAFMGKLGHVTGEHDYASLSALSSSTTSSFTIVIKASRGRHTHRRLAPTPCLVRIREP
jgi:hypothetical protein